MAGADILLHASKLIHLALLNELEFSFLAKLSSLQMLLYMQAEFSIMREYKIAVVKKKIFQEIHCSVLQVWKLIILFIIQSYNLGAELWLNRDLTRIRQKGMQMAVTA